jgi:hypothetical protein
MITAKIIADSISPSKIRIVTMSLVYPRFIHAEFMTHRVFSRNASSSRAEPVEKHIARIKKHCAMPTYWGSNKPGMQAGEEIENVLEAIQQWLDAKDLAIEQATLLNNLGLHKQIVNRVLEPYSHISVVCTSTDWENFFNLRRHPDAQPEIRALADEMWDALQESYPVPLPIGHWHLPYIKWQEKQEYNLTTLLAASTARCARVSYLKHDGTTPNIEEDIKLYDKLVGGVPIHASPTEHQATPLVDPEEKSNNFRGWLQHRELLDQTEKYRLDIVTET